MVFPNYTAGNALTQYGRLSLENIRTQALQSNYALVGLTVAQRAAGANMSVDVAGGAGIANSTYVSVFGTNLAITAADGALNRYDLIVFDSAGVLSVVDGTLASAPNVPALPANKTPIAVVYVAAGVTSIVTANITDLRFMQAVLVNGTKTASNLNNHRVYTRNTTKTTFTLSDEFAPPDGTAILWNVVGNYYAPTGSYYPLSAPPIITGASETATFDIKTTKYMIDSTTRYNVVYGVTPTAPTPAWGSNTGTITQVTDGDYSAFTVLTTLDMNFYRGFAGLGSLAEDTVLKIDLGSSKTIQRLCWAAKVVATSSSSPGGYTIGTLKLKTSTDDSSYTQRASIVNAPDQGGTVAAYSLASVAGPITARYISVTLQYDQGGSAGGPSVYGGVYEIVAWV